MFVEVAQFGRNEGWRYLAAILAVIGGGLVSTTFLFGTVLMLQMVSGDAETLHSILLDAANTFENLWQWGQPFTLADGMYIAAYLFSVCLLAIGPVFAVRFLHKRSIMSLVIGNRGFRWPVLWRSLGVGLLSVGICAAILLLFNHDILVPASDLSGFFVLLPVVLIFVPMQVLGMGVLFQGYVLQSTARFFKNPLMRLLIPSVLFFGVHMGGTETTQGGFNYLIYFAMIGLYLTWLAIHTDGLEAGIGIHIALNVIGLLVVSDDLRSIATPTLFFLKNPAPYLTPFEACLFLVIHYWFAVRGRFNAGQTRTPVGSSGNPSSSQSESS